MKFLLIGLALCFLSGGLFAQEEGFWQAQPDLEDSTEQTSESNSSGEGRWGFGELQLGMTTEAVKEYLSQSKDFSYREFSESLLPYTNLPVFECKGTKFIQRAVFQFYEDKLYSMTIFLNRRRLDFFTLFTTLTNEYGTHTALDPKKVVWENESNRLTLLKPLTLSFLDVGTHLQLLNESEIYKDEEFHDKEDFLNQLGKTQKDEQESQTEESYEAN